MVKSLLEQFGFKAELLEISGFSIFILSLLLLMSVLSWAIILSSGLSVFSTRREVSRMTKKFTKVRSIADAKKILKHEHANRHLNILNNAISDIRSYTLQGTARQGEASPMANSKVIFSEILERSIQKSVLYEVTKLERNLGYLATISSSAPFIGLFGTVVGIMVSFQNIATEGATSLAVVAPGISEALFATGMGLFVAIPALMFYNFFRSGIRSVGSGLSVFGAEAINLIIVNSQELK